MRQYPEERPWKFSRMPSVKRLMNARLKRCVCTRRSMPLGTFLSPRRKPPSMVERCRLAGSEMVASSDSRLGTLPQLAFACSVPSGARLKAKPCTVRSADALGLDNRPVAYALPVAYPRNSTALKLTSSSMYSTFISRRFTLSVSSVSAEARPLMSMPRCADWFTLKPRMSATLPSHVMAQGCTFQMVSEMMKSDGATHARMSRAPSGLREKVAVTSSSPQMRGRRLLSTPAISRSRLSWASAVRDMATKPFLCCLSTDTLALAVLGVPWMSRVPLRSTSLPMRNSGMPPRTSMESWP